MFIYSIGAMTVFQRNNELHKAIEWRKKLDTWAKDNNIKTFNPMITYLKETNHAYSDKLFVDQNDYYIDKCDIAVANLDCIEHSPGSIYELVRFKELRKPVIAFGEPYWSPHINSCISHRCDTLDDVIELLCNEFDQGNI